MIEWAQEFLNIQPEELLLGDCKIYIRGSRAVVARVAHNHKVGSSNLPSPTIEQGLLPFLNNDLNGFRHPYDPT